MNPLDRIVRCRKEDSEINLAKLKEIKGVNTSFTIFSKIDPDTQHDVRFHFELKEEGKFEVYTYDSAKPEKEFIGVIAVGLHDYFDLMSWSLKMIKEENP